MGSELVGKTRTDDSNIKGKWQRHKRLGLPSRKPGSFSNEDC